MTIHWLSLAGGLVIGVLLGAIADWKLGKRLRKQSELRALAKEYASLAGHYRNLQLKEDGTYVPSGETIEIRWDTKDGVLLASGFLATGKPDWNSYIRMSLEEPGIGLGQYTNVNSIHSGIQQVVYSKQNHSFRVLGTNQTRKEFTQYWKLQE
jgi:hypothetical protein